MTRVVSALTGAAPINTFFPKKQSGQRQDQAAQIFFGYKTPCFYPQELLLLTLTK